MPPSTRIAAAYAGICLIWGTTWLAIKVGLPYAPPITAVGVRFLIAGTALLLVACARRELAPLARLPWRLVLAFATCLFGANYVLTYVAEEGLSSGLTAILFGTLPFFTFFFRRLVLAEPATPRMYAGTAIAFAGVATIAAADGMRGTLPYALAVVTAAALAAFANVYGKRYTAVPPLRVLPIAMLLGGAAVTLLGALFEHPDFARLAAPASVASIGYLALAGSALAFFLNSWLLQRIDVSLLNLASLITPVVAVFAGVALGGEHIGPRELFGAALVIGGTALALVPRGPRTLSVAKASHAA